MTNLYQGRFTASGTMNGLLEPKYLWLNCIKDGSKPVGVWTILWNQNIYDKVVSRTIHNQWDYGWSFGTKVFMTKFYKGLFTVSGTMNGPLEPKYLWLNCIKDGSQPVGLWTILCNQNIYQLKYLWLNCIKDGSQPVGLWTVLWNQNIYE